MTKTKWYTKLVYLLVALVLSLGIMAVPGNIVADGVTILFEDFHDGLPGNWTVPHTAVTCNYNCCPNWTDSNPCNREAYDGCNGTFMIADNFCCGAPGEMDTELWTPPIDCSCYSTVMLEFDHFFRCPYGVDVGDVDISNDGGVNWTNILSYTGGPTYGHVSINISAQAAGESDVRVRWHYYSLYKTPPGFWEVDNVKLSGMPLVLVAAFNATPTSGCAPLTVNFTDLSTGAPTTWNWTFPGGSPPSTNGKGPHSVTYDTTGNYTVTLTVSNACGQDTETKTNYIKVGGPPTADFTADKTSGCPPLAVNFTDNSTANNKPITGWNWTFGDGGTSSVKTPSHTYNNTGTYNVSLNVSNACGSGSETKTNFITVSPTPVGGEAYPIDKTSVLALWIGLALLLAGGISWYALRRRRAHS